MKKVCKVLKQKVHYSYSVFQKAQFLNFLTERFHCTREFSSRNVHISISLDFYLVNLQFAIYGKGHHISDTLLMCSANHKALGQLANQSLLGFSERRGFVD